MCTKFEVIVSMVAEINRGSQFLDAPLAQTPTKFGPKKLFLATYFSNPSYVPNFKLPDSTVAEISRGSPIILDAPLAQIPASFGPKSSFLISYTPNPSCIPNLKLLASMVA